MLQWLLGQELLMLFSWVCFVATSTSTSRRRWEVGSPPSGRRLTNHLDALASSRAAQLPSHDRVQWLQLLATMELRVTTLGEAGYAVASVLWLWLANQCLHETKLKR
jgi:hypothetical protein